MQRKKPWIPPEIVIVDPDSLPTQVKELLQNLAAERGLVPDDPPPEPLVSSDP